MKTILLLLSALLLPVSAAEAGGTYRGPAAAPVAYCNQSNCVVSHRCEWRSGRTDCGQGYRYQVMVTETRGYYSDGSTRTWSRGRGARG